MGQATPLDNLDFDEERVHALIANMYEVFFGGGRTTTQEDALTAMTNVISDMLEANESLAPGWKFVLTVSMDQHGNLHSYYTTAAGSA